MRKTVWKFFKKFRGEEFALCDLPHWGCPKTLQRRHLDFIDTKIEENDYLIIRFGTQEFGVFPT